ncbi:MAG: hypothetical protein ACFE9Z_16560 [Promethearchaeota archaeon]
MDGKEFASILGMNKKEQNALERVHEEFPQFREYRSLNEKITPIIGTDILVLTGDTKPINYFVGLFIVFIIVGVNWALCGIILLTENINIQHILGMFILFPLLMVLDWIAGKIGLKMIYIGNFFMVLNSQGIYYKKFGKPKFLAWSDMVKIVAEMKHYGASFYDLNVDIYLNSKRKIRFYALDYQPKRTIKGKYIMFKPNLDSFAEVFWGFNRKFGYGDCPFFYYDRGSVLDRIIDRFK